MFVLIPSPPSPESVTLLRSGFVTAMGVFLPWLHASLSLNSNDTVLVGFTFYTNVSPYVLFVFFHPSALVTHADTYRSRPVCFCCRRWVVILCSAPLLVDISLPPVPAVKAACPFVPCARCSQGRALAGTVATALVLLDF